MLRPATDADREGVRRWRNHPEVRAASLTTHEIGPDEHASWWAKALPDPERRILVYERHGTPSGVVTFADIADGPPRSAYWGFYLDVDGLQERGELLPAWIEVEREAIRYAFTDDDGLRLDVLHGEVLARNEAVRRLNRRHGFRETASSTRVVDGEEQDVLRLELTADEVRATQRQRTVRPDTAGTTEETV